MSPLLKETMSSFSVAIRVLSGLLCGWEMRISVGRFYDLSLPVWTISVVMWGENEGVRTLHFVGSVGMIPELSRIAADPQATSRDLENSDA
jgi:hypothetical protein